MSDTTLQYLVILAFSVSLTVWVGRVLYSSGEPFLVEVFEGPGVAASVNRLLAVLFQLLTLGVVLLVTNIEIGLDGLVQTAAAKIGVVLIVIGAAHGLVMRVLLGQRARRQAAELEPFLPAPYGAGYPGGFPPPYPPPAGAGGSAG